MPIGAIFWMLIIIWVVFFGWTRWGGPTAAPFGWAPNLLLFILIFLLGWHSFGFIVK